MRGLYYHFSDLRFKQILSNNDFRVPISSVCLPSEFLKCRLWKWLLAHPTKATTTFWPMFEPLAKDPLSSLADLHTIFHVQVLLSFQQPTFQQFTQSNYCSAAWSAFHLKHVIIMFVSTYILKCRLLKLLLDHPMNIQRVRVRSEGLKLQAWTLDGSPMLSRI